MDKAYRSNKGRSYLAELAYYYGGSAAQAFMQSQPDDVIDGLGDALVAFIDRERAVSPAVSAVPTTIEFRQP